MIIFTFDSYINYYGKLKSHIYTIISILFFHKSSFHKSSFVVYNSFNNTYTAPCTQIIYYAVNRKR